MAMLAKRNLLRGLALGLPSGQGMAKQLRIPVMTRTQLTQGLPAAEVAVLRQLNGRLMKKTPLWYYVLREAADVFRLLDSTPFGRETRETMDKTRTLEVTIAACVRNLPMRDAAE